MATLPTPEQIALWPAPNYVNPETRRPLVRHTQLHMKTEQRYSDVSTGPGSRDSSGGIGGHLHRDAVLQPNCYHSRPGVGK